jgi:hypothetical protein
MEGYGEVSDRKGELRKACPTSERGPHVRRELLGLRADGGAWKTHVEEGAGEVWGAHSTQKQDGTNSNISQVRTSLPLLENQNLWLCGDQVDLSPNTLAKVS